MVILLWYKELELRMKLSVLEMIQDYDDIFENGVPQHRWHFYHHQIFLVSGSNPAVGGTIFLSIFLLPDTKYTFFV